MPLVDPNGAFGYADGEWKLWKQPFVRRNDDWVEPKGVWVRKGGEWVHVWTEKIPVDDMAVVATPVNMDTAAEIELAWIVPFSVRVAESYVVYRPDGTVVGTTTEAGMVDAAPVPGVGAYSVVALAGDEEFMTSVSNSGRIAQAPSGLTATRSGDAVTLAWSVDSVGVHDHIQVVRNASPDQAWNLPFGTTSWTDPSAGVGGQVNSYKVRALVHNTPGPYSAEASVSVPANVPTNVAVAATTTIGELKLTYSAPSSGSVTGYQVQANNGSWVAASSNSSGATYKFTGSGSKSMRVLAKSAGGNSAYVTKSATPLWTAKPNVPKSVSVAATSTVGQLKLTWSAPSADSTHSAASTYQVQTSTNNSSWTTVSGNKTSPYTHSFGSSGSGVRYMRVRATNTAGSSSYVSKSGTPLWAYPAPAAPSVSKFGPETSFGRMVLTFKTSSANNSQYRVAFKQGSGSWVYGSWTNVGNNTTKAVHVGTSANETQTVYAFVDVKNSTGQSTRSTQANYGVRGSPFVWQPLDTGHYRSGRYGQNTENHNRPYQGYYSNSSYNYDGLWFYGNNAFKNFMTTTGTHKPATYRVPTVWRVTMVRNGGGNNSSDAVYVGTTSTGTKPANGTAGAGAHVVYDVVHLGNLKYGESFQANVPASLYNNLITGARQGFGVATGSGKPYMYMYSIQENGFSGWVHVEHIG